MRWLLTGKCNLRYEAGRKRRKSSYRITWARLQVARGRIGKILTELDYVSRELPCCERRPPTAPVKRTWLYQTGSLDVDWRNKIFSDE